MIRQVLGVEPDSAGWHDPRRPASLHVNLAAKGRKLYQGAHEAFLSHLEPLRAGRTPAVRQHFLSFSPSSFRLFRVGETMLERTAPWKKEFVYQWSVEVSVYIHPRAHRCGVGRALYTALFDLLRRQGYVNAYAGVTLPNAASVGLHESLGFAPIGVFSRIGFKFDQWHDVAWLQLRLVDDPRPLRDPLPTAGLFQDQRVAAMLETCAQSIAYIPGSSADGP